MSNATGAIVWVAILTFVSSGPAHAGTPSFRLLSDPGAPFIWAQPNAISGDGSVIVGARNFSVEETNPDGSTTYYNYYGAFRWTAASGIVGLGDPATTDYYSIGSAISPDGRIIVGQRNTAALGTHAFRWTAEEGIKPLADPSGSHDGAGFGVSNSGLTVGQAYTGSVGEAIYWATSGVLTEMGGLGGGDGSSRARGISADGQTIVGDSSSAQGTRAFRWTAQQGMISLAALPEPPAPAIFVSSQANAVSADGTVIVGQQYPEPFRWTAATGMQRLGVFEDSTAGDALAISADGSWIAGSLRSGVTDMAVVWGPDLAPHKLADVLVDAGVDLTGIDLYQISGISADGTVVTGYGYDTASATFTGFVAVIPEPATAAILMTGLAVCGRRRTRRVVSQM